MNCEDTTNSCKMQNDNMSKVIKFCQIARKRSAENVLAMGRLIDLPGVMAALLRLELDTLTKAFYLISHDNLDDRERLASEFLQGRKWTTITSKGKNKIITDRDFVTLHSKISGWSSLVYKFGCAFVHFSNFHDYSQKNPFEHISMDEKKDILLYLRQYHGGPETDVPSFSELASYFPAVFTKISDNLEYYLEMIETNEVSDGI